VLESVKTACVADKNAVCQRLQITGDSLAASHSRELCPQLLTLAETLCQLTCLYTLQPRNLSLGIPGLDQCSHLVFCFVSVGPRLGEAVGDFFQKKDYLEGFLLDHLGNEILFNASNQMNEIIAQRLYAQGMIHTSRYSPGEGNLGMEYQAVILEALQRLGEIPVQLNDHYMLSPEKSILYLIGAGEDICGGSIRHDCRRCDRLDCYFRSDFSEKEV